MSNFKEKYKQKGHTFGNADRRRITRAEEQDVRRKEIRSEAFSRLRPLPKVQRTENLGKILYM